MNLDQAFQSELLKLGHDRTIEWAIQDELAKLGWKDMLPGGKGDEKKPSEFPAAAVAKGQKHETEHTKSKHLAKEIAIDHLTEDKKYYEKLDAVEKKAFLAELRKLGWDFKDDEPSRGPIGRAEVAEKSPPPCPPPEKPKPVERIEKAASEKTALTGKRILGAIHKRMGVASGKLSPKGSRSWLEKVIGGIYFNIKGEKLLGQELRPGTVGHDLALKHDVKSTQRAFPNLKRPLPDLSVKTAISAADLGPQVGKLPQPTPGEPDQPSEEQGRKKTWKRLGMLADDVVLTAKNLLHDWHGRV